MAICRTATALVHNKSLLTGRDIRFVGVDYDRQYIDKGLKIVERADLQDQIKLLCKSVYDETLPELLASVDTAKNKDGKFDSVYFSGSFSLMPDPVKALGIAVSLLRPNGRIYITQTFQKEDSPPTPLRHVKPLLKYVTTIDFGQLVYATELEAILEQAQSTYDLSVLQNGAIPGSVDNVYQSARLIVLARTSTKDNGLSSTARKRK